MLGNAPRRRSGGVALTLATVVVGWVMFRAETIGQAASVYRAMFGLKGLGFDWIRGHSMALSVLILALGIALTKDTYDLSPPTRTRTALVEAALLALCITRLAQPSPFLYFQF
jgi:alginate O-acetyltransferase complex protein AlgI